MSSSAYFEEFPIDEWRGIDLANDTIGRIRLSGLRLPGAVSPPEGPQFNYDDGNVLFSGRRGIGPLRVAWDTNLLLDYFEFGWQLWAGQSLPRILPTEQGDELEGLQLLISLWALRDVRFHVLEGFVDDSKRKLLPEHLRQNRLAMWESFCAALVSVGDEADWSVGLNGRSQSNELDQALLRIPAGNDRKLVQDAMEQNVHVFLTRDKGILRARDVIAPFGLLLASPLDLIEELAAAGALHCMFEPQYLYWPLPDQRRVTHLIRALKPSAEVTEL